MKWINDLDDQVAVGRPRRVGLEVSEDGERLRIDCYDCVGYRRANRAQARRIAWLLGVAIAEALVIAWLTLEVYR